MTSILPAKIYDCLYGAPGTGKSEACARLAEYLYRTTGLRTRIALGDGSALTYEHLVQAGVADICDFSVRPDPTTTLKRLSLGWWPDETGLLRPTKPEVAATIGLYLFEGLSVAGSYLMQGLAAGSARGEKIGQDSPVRYTEAAEMDPRTGQPIPGTGITYGGNAPIHYHVAQTRLQECLVDSKGLPGHVIWTAHESANNPESDLAKELVIGPSVVGKALTATIQRAFNNTLHCCSVAKRTKQTDAFTGRTVDDLDVEYRLYTRDHFSAAGTSMTRYKACTRGTDAKVPQYVTGGGPGDTLLAFYEMLAKMRDLRQQDVRAKIDAPSLTGASSAPSEEAGRRA